MVRLKLIYLSIKKIQNRSASGEKYTSPAEFNGIGKSSGGGLVILIPEQTGSEESPGFPKQLDDIKAVIAFLKSSFTTDLSFAVFGVSAGAHLAMLYSYWWDRNNRDVKVVVSHVGPVDFMDDGYCRNILLYPLIVPLIGPHPCAEFPDIWNQTSPINYIEEASPPTIGFYGNLDILVPFGQMPALQGRLESVRVANEFTRYQGGHNGWPDTSIQDMYRKITDFLQVHM
ncbi:hypothetical protein Fcan01_24485 [Folsomia candida]|uniref:BD-FAE-like domain-containing protein n=1 Tax=Folsomia candida TaxID=158441 RepID=A0A226D7S1_FOLCA|nr:hypothetical protein Fcan01_24485 [Folsomia candida]